MDADNKVLEKEGETQGEQKFSSDELKSESPAGDGLAALVAKHYNEIEEKGLASREKSKISILRKFNNWTKSMILNDAVDKLRADGRRNLVGLDLCCGKGGDLIKWEKTRMMKHVVFVDIAETSVNQCKERYEKLKCQHEEQYQRSGRRLRYLFSAEFIVSDCTKESLRNKLANPEMKFDIVSCQFALHYSFESYSQAHQMLQNAGEMLDQGGYFIGTIPNANRIVKRLQKCGQSEFGNEVYSLKFECEEPYPVFGARYFFNLDDAVSCPEFLVHFPTLERLANGFRLSLVYSLPFDDFHDKHSATRHGKSKLLSMGALETYPPFRGQRLRFEEKHYKHAAKFLKRIRRKYPETGWEEHRVDTISSVEWEAITLYLAFCFTKK